MTKDTGLAGLSSNGNGHGAPPPPANTRIPMSASTATIYVPTPIHPTSMAYAQRVFARVLEPSAEMSPEECMAQSDAVVVRVGNFPAALVNAGAPRLKIIARNGTGYDSIDLPSCIANGVVVTNVPGGNAAAVGELTVALSLAVLRRIVEANNRIRSGERLPSINALSPGLRGMTVALVGMGSIAYEAARLFAAFSCPIVVYSPTSPATRWVEPEDTYPVPVPHMRVGSLDELLDIADVVSLHCPLTDATRGLIGARELGRMKNTAVLVNTSRGGMIDEVALAAALQDPVGGIYGAGLDVMATEPAYGENLGALRDLRNVVILPHLGGSTDETTEKGCTEAIDIVVEYLEGKGARNRVA